MNASDRSQAERAVALVMALVWCGAFVMHVDLAVADRLSWAPLYVQPAPDARSLPCVEGFWAEVEPQPGDLAAGDCLVAVGGRTLAGAGRLRVLAETYAAAAQDRRVAYTVERAGIAGTATAQLSLIPYNAPWSYAPLILGLGIAVSIMYLRSGQRAAARAIAIAGWAYSLHWAAFLSGGGWRTPVGLALHTAGLGLTLPMALIGLRRFGLVRDEARSDWRRHWPWIFVAIVPLHASWQLGTPLPGPHSLLPLLLGYAAFTICLLFFVARTYRRGDAVARRQLRFVLLGLYVALAPVSVAALAVAWNPAWRPLYEWSLLSLLALPLAFTIALTNYQFFDIDRVISATAGYSIVLFGVLALLLGAGPPAAAATSEATGISPPVVEAAFAIMLAAIVLFGGSWLRPRVERRIFRERGALEDSVHELRQALRLYDAPGPLLEYLGKQLTELLALQRCALYTRGDEAYAAIYAHGPAVPVAFDSRGRLPAMLEDTGQAVDETRWRRWARSGLLAEVNEAGLEALDAQLVLPILREHELAAFVVLGRKHSGDVYTPLDVALLESLCDTVSGQLDLFEAAQLAGAEREHQQELANYAPAALRAGSDTQHEASEGTVREVTLLFVDIRSYTSLVEDMPPDEVFRLVNAYTVHVSECVQRRGGWVVEFQGDGLMIVFGAPESLAEKEEAAVVAALEVVSSVRAGIPGIEDIPIDIGVGIASGEAYVGDVRSADRTIWCVIGNTTNLAARLQARTRDFGVAIAIDEATRLLAPRAAAAFKPREHVAIKGRSDEMTIYVSG